MVADIEITLSFDGNRWCTEINECHISAIELTELEDRITHTVRQMPCYAHRKSVRVHMGFDFDVIPTWLRQYHSHYFNSQLTVSMPLTNAAMILPS